MRTLFLGFLISKKEGKDQESIQSSTTPDPGYQWESDIFTIRQHKAEPRGQPKKILNCFSGHFFLKTDRCGRAGFYVNLGQKQMRDCGIFFLKLGTIFFESCACKVILLDIVQVRP